MHTGRREDFDRHQASQVNMLGKINIGKDASLEQDDHPVVAAALAEKRIIFAHILNSPGSDRILPAIKTKLLMFLPKISAGRQNSIDVSRAQLYHSRLGNISFPTPLPRGNNPLELR